MSAPNHHPHLKTIRFAIEPAKIAMFKAIVESYDNLATLRTEDPTQHHLMLYFSDDLESEVRALLDSLRVRFSIREIS
jgi:hypothetical protein